MGRKNKQPKTAKGFPLSGKIPKTSNLETAYQREIFRWGVDTVQLEGEFGFHLCELRSLFEDVIARLKHFESMTWAEVIPGTGSHEVIFSKIARGAQETIQRIFGDELDVISLRLGGRPRIFGVRRGAVCSLLFYDPEHQICPSEKKHT